MRLMANGTYIGTVVVGEIGYKYILEPIDATVVSVDTIEKDQKVFYNQEELLAELPAPLNTIEHINPLLFPCVILIEDDEEYGKPEVETVDEEAMVDSD